MQLALILLMGWIAQNIGWGVSFALHVVGAFLLGFFVVPVTLGDNSISLETRIGSEEVRFEASEQISAEESAVGGAPIDLSPVVQKIGSTDTPASNQFEFNPEIQSSSVLNSLEGSPGSGGRGEGIGSGVGDGTGGSGKIEFFGTKGTGNSVVYVVDVSGSMATNQRFETAVDEILKSLDRLTKLQRFSVVFYNHRDIPLFDSQRTSKLLVANPPTKARARRWISGELHPGGGTQPIPALERAIKMRPDLIYLMTDGEIPPETREFLKQMNKRKTVIHTIAFQSIDGQMILKQIAEDHGGTFRFVP